MVEKQSLETILASLRESERTPVTPIVHLQPLVGEHLRYGAVEGDRLELDGLSEPLCPAVANPEREHEVSESPPARGNRTYFPTQPTRSLRSVGVSTRSQASERVAYRWLTFVSVVWYSPHLADSTETNPSFAPTRPHQLLLPPKQNTTHLPAP